MTKKCKTYEAWVAEFQARHGDRYSYQSVTRVDNKPYVNYTCRVHGSLTQLAGSHAIGKGCRLCGFEATGLAMSAKAEANNCDATNIARCQEVHGSRYTYSGTHLRDSVRFINYSCTEHGAVSQQLAAHLRGQGCPTCAVEARKYDFDDYVRRCNEVHSSRYSYLEISYQGAATVVYTCQHHGRVEQLAADHLRGSGCRECARQLVGTSNANSVEVWKAKFTAAHGELYSNYDIVRDSRAHVYYECAAHGAVLQDATAHASGVGCPKCATGVMGNKHTGEIAAFLRGLGVHVVEESSLTGARKRWDVVVPDHKIAIEFDGVYYHSERFKPNKSAMLDRATEAASVGFRQLNVWEDEWYEKRNIVERLIASACGVSNEPAVYARKTVVVQVTTEDAVKFMECNHIQGFTAGAKYLGLVHGDTLVACMVYSYKAAGRSTRRVDDCVDIQRYATSCKVVGGFQKLLNQILKDEAIKTVISYSDPRLFSGGMYAKAGFIAGPEGKPDYCYVKNSSRIHKRARQKSWFQNRAGVLYDPDLTEHELATLNGYHRLWFRGKVKWTWSRPPVSTSQHQSDSAPKESS